MQRPQARLPRARGMRGVTCGSMMMGRLGCVFPNSRTRTRRRLGGEETLRIHMTPHRLVTKEVGGEVPAAEEMVTEEAGPVVSTGVTSRFGVQQNSASRTK